MIPTISVSDIIKLIKAVEEITSKIRKASGELKSITEGLSQLRDIIEVTAERMSKYVSTPNNAEIWYKALEQCRSCTMNIKQLLDPYATGVGFMNKIRYVGDSSGKLVQSAKVLQRHVQNLGDLQESIEKSSMSKHRLRALSSHPKGFGSVSKQTARAQQEPDIETRPSNKVEQSHLSRGLETTSVYELRKKFSASNLGSGDS